MKCLCSALAASLFFVVASATASLIVESFSILNAPSSGASSLQYRVVFSDPVQNVGLNDFSVTPVSGSAGGYVTGVTAVDSRTYDVDVGVVGTRTSSGGIRLDISNAHDIMGLDSSALAAPSIFAPTHTVTKPFTSFATAGAATYRLEPGSFPSSSPIQLNTGSIGLLVPQLAAAYPNNEAVRLDLQLSTPLHAAYIADYYATQTGSNIPFEYVADFYAFDTVAGDYAEAFTAIGRIEYVFAENGSVESLHQYNLVSLNFATVNIASSEVGSINTFAMKFRLNLAAAGFIAAFDPLISESAYPTAVPEPGFYAGLSGLLAGLFVLWRRLRK